MVTSCLNYLNVAVTVDKNILKFEITMYDTVFVQEMNGRDDLTEYATRFDLGHAFAFVEIVVEFATACVLHY